MAVYKLHDYAYFNIFNAVIFADVDTVICSSNVFHHLYEVNTTSSTSIHIYVSTQDISAGISDLLLQQSLRPLAELMKINDSNALLEIMQLSVPEAEQRDIDA